MGTRHLICVVKDNEYKLAQYGQWDGYPEGRGVNILTFLRDFDRDVFEKNVAGLSWAIGSDLDKIVEKHPDDWAKVYPQFSRDCGSDVLYIIQNNATLLVKNDIEFAADSLFCEYAYVIDLDKNTFEVYEGFNHTPLTEDDRFFSLQEHGTEYKPITLSIVYNLNDLPTEDEFLEYFKPKDDEE